MKLKLGIKNKMQLFLISLSVAIYAIAIGYISTNAKKTAYNDSVELVKANAEKFAYKIQSDLNEYMAVVRTLATAFTVYVDMPKEQWDPLFVKMYDKIYFISFGIAGSLIKSTTIGTDQPDVLPTYFPE